MQQTATDTITGVALRHETWGELTSVSSLGRRTMSSIPSYRLFRAATRIDVSAGARLLLVHLIGYLGPDDVAHPESRFVVFPGNTRLADELRCTPRSIQRQADELEAAGFLRRCYNGSNRRTGFDLTPLAMRHDEVIGAVVAIQTRRRQERDAAQMELSLEADRIARPATPASPRGDANVAHNSTEGIGFAVAADALDAHLAASGKGRTSDPDVTRDRDGRMPVDLPASVASRLSGSGATSHIGWTTAVRSVGEQRALALHDVARRDPSRRRDVERYFSWLLRMMVDGHGDVIAQAVARIAARTARMERRETAAAREEATAAAPNAIPARGMPDAAARPTPPPIAPLPADHLRSAIRTAVGQRAYERWLDGCSIERDDDAVVLTLASAFAAGWVSDNLAEAVSGAVGGCRVLVRSAA